MKKTFIINSFDEVIGTVAQLLKSSHTANCYDIPTAEKKLTHQDMNAKGLILPLCVCVCVWGGGIRRGRGGLIEGKEKAEKCVGVEGGGGGPMMRKAG